MKKVVYSIRKMGNSECRWTGVGYLSEGDLMIPAMRKGLEQAIQAVADRQTRHREADTGRQNIALEARRQMGAKL